VNVHVGLNKGEGALLILCKVRAGENISIVNELELSGEDCDDTSKEEFFH
jgi:hypothetical protein